MSRMSEMSQAGQDYCNANYGPEDIQCDESIISLPMASDTARSEARFITDAAGRVARQLALVEAAVQDGQRRIRATERYVMDLDRHGSIDHGAAQEILKRLLRPSER